MACQASAWACAAVCNQLAMHTRMSLHSTVWGQRWWRQKQCGGGGGGGVCVLAVHVIDVPTQMLLLFHPYAAVTMVEHHQAAPKEKTIPEGMAHTDAHTQECVCMWWWWWWWWWCVYVCARVCVCGRVSQVCTWRVHTQTRIQQYIK